MSKITDIELKHDYENGVVFDASQYNTDQISIEALFKKLIQSITPGESGADHIKTAPIIDLEGSDVQTLLAALKTLVDKKIEITLITDSETGIVQSFIKLPSGAYFNGKIEGLEADQVEKDSEGNIISETYAKVNPATELLEVNGTQVNVKSAIYAHDLEGNDIGEIDKTYEKIVEFNLQNDIRGTTQNVTVNGSGDVTKIEHKNSSNVIIRRDDFTYGTNLVTEVRTIISTGATITYIYHTDTLQTEVI